MGLISQQLYVFPCPPALCSCMRGSGLMDSARAYESGLGYILMGLDGTSYKIQKQMNSKNSDLVGRTVQGYKIIKEIGEGKFSSVYRAETENKMVYALKHVKIFDMADQKSRDKCLKEVEMMKPLDHPNIIKYIDSFIENNELYIVTEWAEKGDLKKLLKEHSADENPFDEPTIWEYIRQISSALKHMHDKKTMHRDLKPANIFISSDMTLKVGDLGLGRVFGAQTMETFSKVGTPLYMSPQLIQGNGYNFNADVWSLGCICYELCELNSPFRNKHDKMSLMDLFENITKCNYKPISNRYSSELSQVIKKMIVVDPNYRFTSEQVLQIAQKNLVGIKKPLLDPFIVMEDIYIKLNLLDYEKDFCKSAQRKPINRFYFAIVDQNSKENEQLFYFLQLCYWILFLSKPDKRREKIAIFSKTNIDWSSPQNACKKLVSDLGSVGVHCEEIDQESLVYGYGQSICYIINQILNRELVRINFQFQEPNQTPLHQREGAGEQEEDIEKSEKLEDEIDRSESSESIEEQSQFEQSLFFKKGNKKFTKDDQKLLDKIHEFEAEDEEKTMIVAKVDETEWKLECMRVDKKLAQVSTFARQARKKIGYHHFETVKVSALSVADLIKTVQPLSMRLATDIQTSLSQIKRGESSIQGSMGNISSEYNANKSRELQLRMRADVLNQGLKEIREALEKVEGKLEDKSSKIEICTSEAMDNGKVGTIRARITQLKEEITSMVLKERILEWQVRQNLLRQRKQGKVLEVGDNFDFEQN